MTSRRDLMALALGLALAPASAFAQDAWPSRSIKLIVPFAAGGNTDTIARLTGERLSKSLPATIVIENITGGGGQQAANTTARAAPDGYTLFVVASPQFAIVPAMQNVTYDPVKDFTPVKNIAFNGFVLMAHKSLPATDLKELLAWGKANPDKLAYASGGVGSVSHLSSALLFAKAGLAAKHVVYRGGAPANVDVLAGHVPMTFSNMSDALPHVKNPDVRFLAVSSAKRAAQMPNVGTVAELAFPDFATGAWNGLVGPANLPAAIVARLETELSAFLRDPVTQSKFAELGLEPDTGNTADFAKQIKADIPAWADIVKLAGAGQKPQ